MLPIVDASNHEPALGVVHSLSSTLIYTSLPTSNTVPLCTHCKSGMLQYSMLPLAGAFIVDNSHRGPALAMLSSLSSTLLGPNLLTSKTLPLCTFSILEMLQYEVHASHCGPALDVVCSLSSTLLSSRV